VQKLGWKQVIATAPRKARVLIVEDHDDVRRTLERLVAALGYESKSAASAEAADAWLTAERFDVMLLDVELPRMKGPEFLSWALDRDPEIAVIMLTGLDDPQVAVQCIESGARTYLVKPVETEFLRLALRDALAVRRLLLDRNGTGEPR
jgi:DNA-binding NtrC family response regulator